MSTEEEEWKVVTKDDKKRVMRRRGRSNHRVVEHSSLGQTSLSLSADVDALLEALSRCKALLLQTNFFQNLVPVLKDQATEKTTEACLRTHQLVCYGIGNFSHTSLSYYSASLWQLACSMCIRDVLSLEFRDVSVVFYDPCSTVFEETFLTAQLHATVLRENEEGNRPAKGVPTLFYMPHCPMNLYENVVWTNWEEFCSRTPIVLVGNSLRNHCESLRAINTNDCPCIKTLRPWIQEKRLDDMTTAAKARKSDLPGNFLGAFNDTYLVYVAKKDGESQVWPERPYETIKSLTSGVTFS